MLLTRVRAGRLLGAKRMLAVGIRILMAVAFPRPVFRKDFDLNVGLFAALGRAVVSSLHRDIVQFSAPGVVWL